MLRMAKLYLPVLTLITAMACSSSSVASDTSEFPSYLSSRFCQDTAADFMTSSLDSLQRYRHNQLTTLHRGGMNNIRKFIDQRASWLQECDAYLQATSKLRIFKDSETTDNIFSAMNSINEELTALIQGVSYGDSAEQQSALAAQKFDRLFGLVETHKNLLLLKGQLVVR